MSSTTTPPNEADIIFNKASVALARSQRLIASWLPTQAASQLATHKTEEGLSAEEAELFMPVPELLGVGAALPKDAADGIAQRKDRSGLEELRRQLLGKNGRARSAGAPVTARPVVSSTLGSKAIPPKALPPKSARSDDSDEDEEEEGRSAAFRSSKKASKLTAGKKRDAQGRVNEMKHVDPEEEGSDGDEVQRSSKKRPASFLDEVLAEKSKKNRKKKREKGAHATETQ